MTQEEILEYNRRCADFMKPDSYDKRRKDYPFPFPVIEIVPAENIMGYGSVPEGEIKHYRGQPDLMKYHSDWNWIMEVVEAIEKLDRGDEHGKFRLIRYGSSVNWNNLPPSINSKSPKEAVVQAINQFLIWYKKNKV